MEFLFGLFIVLSIIAMVYLIVNLLGLNDLLPKALTNILVKVSVTIIFTAIPLGIYDLVGIDFFGKVAVAVFAIGIFFILKEIVYDKIKREYRKKFGSVTSDGEWICKKCGEANHKINRKCTACNSIRE